MTGFDRAPDGSISGVVTSRGSIATRRVGVAVAGNSSRLAEMAGFRLPITSYALQAFVSEPLKPGHFEEFAELPDNTDPDQSDDKR